MATANSSEDIEAKRNTAFAFFNRITRDPLFTQNQPILRHVIVCKERLCLAEEVHPGFSIAYSPYEAINVLSYPQAHLHEYLFFVIYRAFMENSEMTFKDLGFGESEADRRQNEE